MLITRKDNIKTMQIPLRVNSFITTSKTIQCNIHCDHVFDVVRLFMPSRYLHMDTTMTETIYAPNLLRKAVVRSSYLPTSQTYSL